jgi:uncharacterized protein YndB with AHSA1/START domain
MIEDNIATAEVTINATRERVWQALVSPAEIKKYMFGSDVRSDWKPGSPITFQGEFKGKRYEDKGRIVEAQPGRVLSYTHFSPLAGLPDKPENYHTVTIALSDAGGATRVTLTQDHNATDEARRESEKNWTMMLGGLKKLLEA